MRNFIKQTGIISLVSIIAFVAWISIQFVYGWTAPTTSPPDPNNNPPIPIISGRSSNPSTMQEKTSGNLSIAGLFEVVLDAIFMENVGIGTDTPTEKLHLEGGNFLHIAGQPKHIDALTPADSGDDAFNVYISGKYAYVGHNLGLEIVDISNPADPKRFSYLYEDSCDSGPNPCALSYVYGVYVVGRYAYAIGRYGVYDGGLAIIDISDPSQPTHIASFYNNDPSCNLNCFFKNPIDIYVSGQYAYLTSKAGSGEPFKSGIEIVDISNPRNPRHAGSINDDGAGGNRALNRSNNLYVSGNYAYVASYGDNGLAIIDISNPSEPTHINSIFNSTCDSGPTGPCALNRSYGIYVSGNYAYVTSYSDDGLAIIDISNPSEPIHVKSIFDNTCDSGPTGPCALERATDIYISGNYAYVSSEGNSPILGGMAIIDISNPNNPRHVKSIFDNDISCSNNCILDGAYAIKVAGKYAYLVSQDSDDSDKGLEILDISGIDAPSASIGNIAASQINVSENMDIGNNLNVGSGLNVGTGGIKTDGDFSITGTTNTVGGLIIEKRNATQGDPTINLTDGRIWLRTDL